MAQFGGNKNAPPWARSGAPVDNMPGLMGAAGGPPGGPFGGPPPGGPPVFQHGLLHNNPSVTLGAAMGVGTVSYPRPPLGPPHFGAPPNAAQQILQQQQAAAAVVGASIHQHQQQQHQQQQQQQHGPPGPGQPSQRVFTGTVTKLHDNFGFVDEDVFFQTNVVKGQNPRVNDRVLVEAGYNPNMPFKWNATRIQVLPNQRGGGGGGGAGGNSLQPTATPNNLAFAPPSQGGGNIQRNNPRNDSYGGNRDRDRMRRDSPGRRDRDRERNDRRRDDRAGNNRDRDREQRSRDKDGRGSNPPVTSLTSGQTASPAPERTPANNRKRSRSPQRTNRSRTRSRSPPRRRARTTPRYNVSVPKLALLSHCESTVMELKKRYFSMYIPSDFFLADHTWMNTFPVHRNFKVQCPSAFHVFNKEYVSSPGKNDAVFDPPDADYAYCVKVMLMASPPLQDFYEKTCHLIEKGSAGRDHLIHPTRALQFLVGVRGKNETMAIGGPWSPSLDGPDPESDPGVLVKTAIRTCKALAGIDLSGCTQWKKFLEIHYRRQETASKAARTETTVLFLPDVWSVMPTQTEFDEQKETYAEALKEKLEPKPKEEEKDEEVETMETDGDGDGKDEEEGEEESGEKGEAKTKPTHWAELDVKTMKVTELREELEARKLSSKGLKSQLVGRLQKDIKEEQEREEKEEEEKKKKKEEEEQKAKEEEEKKKEDDDDMEVVAVVKKDEKSKQKTDEERTKQRTISAYKFPNKPCILVHPNPKAKSGKFDCMTVSLSVLLDYRSDDNKEGTFEVSLFAELFNEMLIRDSGFKLYKAIVEAPEKKKEEKKEKKEEEKKEKKEEEKKEKKEEEKKEKEEEKKDDKESEPKEGGEEKKEEKKEEEKKEEKKKPKMVTFDKDLLSAASYFDLSHIGYLETKDLEDIIFTLNLSLSRAQIKKLVAKVTTGRDQVNYRVMTDREEKLDDEEENEAEEENSISEEDLRRMGMGFKAFFEKAEGKASPEEAKEAKGGLCMYNGGLIDIGKLLSQLDRSEKARNDTVKRLTDATKSVKELKVEAEKTNNIKEKLQTEVKDLKKKLRTTEDDLKVSLADTTKYYATIKEVFEKVDPHLEKERMEKEEEARKKAEEEAAAAAARAATEMKKEEDDEEVVNGEKEEQGKKEEVKKEEDEDVKKE